MKEKKFYLFIGLLSWAFVSSIAQTFKLDLEATMLKNNGAFKKGTSVKLVEFTHSTSAMYSVRNTDGTYIDDEGVIESFYVVDNQGNKVDINSKIDDCFDFKYKDIQDFWDAQIITNVLYMLKKKGFQKELRQEMEDDALQYIQQVKDYNLELNDPYLENYVYSLIAKIAPVQLIDGRTGNINVIIQQNPSINAACFPNGTIVLNTGLLAVLHSEDELVAILAHEIAHFILDHSVQNVNKAISRQKRAEFWAALATGITAVAEGYAASKNSYYTPGAATLSMAVLSSNIASQVVDHLGMEYNHEQEYEADCLAVQALEILGYDKNALATALSRMEKEYVMERSNAMYFSSYTHPALVRRIENSGTPSENVSKPFEKLISFAITNVASMKYEDRKFRQCLPLVSQNIENGIALADDYILKANCLLAMQNTEQSNLEVLQLISIAKSLDETNVNIHKTEILAHLRLNKKEEAMTLLSDYIGIISSMNEQLNAIESDNTWDRYKSYIGNEKKWAKQMLIKLRGM